MGALGGVLADQRQVGGDEGPFFVGDIARVGLPIRRHARILPRSRARKFITPSRLGGGADNAAYEVNGELKVRRSKETAPSLRSEDLRSCSPNFSPRYTHWHLRPSSDPTGKPDASGRHHAVELAGGHDLASKIHNAINKVKLSKETINRSPLKIFVLVLALSIPTWLIQPRDWPISASVGAPLMAALILVYREGGVGGVRRLLSRVFDQRRIRNRIWYVPIIFLMPILYLLTYGVVRLMRLPFPNEPFIPFLLIPLLFALFFTLAIGEEVGWMGYAVDPMQDRWSALTTSVVLGLVTAIWHLVPLIKMGRTLIWIAWWALGSISVRILTVWLYNNTGRSLFAAIVFHAMNNLSFALFPNYGSHWDPAVAGVITATVAVIVTFLWGPKTLARYRYG